MSYTQLLSDRRGVIVDETVEKVKPKKAYKIRVKMSCPRAIPPTHIPSNSNKSLNRKRGALDELQKGRATVLRMRITLERDFSTREELDAFVRSRFGADANKNIDVVIEMSEEKMTALSLSEKDTVHGARVAKQEVKEEGKVKN